MKAYIVKGFNQADYEDHIEYIAAIVFDEAEANALVEKLESRTTGYT